MTDETLRVFGAGVSDPHALIAVTPEGAVQLEILDDAKIWNHAPEPNTGEHPTAGDGVSSYALRDIASGEELTDDYGLHDELAWFEALCNEYGAASCSALGRSQR